jgi:hypothetical protein
MTIAGCAVPVKKEKATVIETMIVPMVSFVQTT